MKEQIVVCGVNADPVVQDMLPETEEAILQNHAEMAPVYAAVEAEEARVQSHTASPDSQDLENRLKTASPPQIDNWIDTNVNNIAGVRMVLKAILKLLVKIYLRRG